MFRYFKSAFISIRNFFNSLFKTISPKARQTKTFLKYPVTYSMAHAKGFYMYHYTNKARVQRIKNKRIAKAYAS
jgi:hypothetical protein